MKQLNRLRDFPVSFFSVVMGLGGFTIACHKAEQVLHWPFNISTYLLVLTTAVFAVLSLLYGLKILKHREQVFEELHHPIKLSFFPSFSISLILFGIAMLTVDITVSRYLWLAGSLIHLAFTLYVMNAWIHHIRFEILHMNPAWFILVVGNMLVPIASVQHFSPEISWFFFSIGLVYWVVLLSIVFNRMIFHHPLPDKLLPTFFILIAPPAVGFVAYISLTGQIDNFARILYYTALFLVLLLMTQSLRFFRLRFFLSWWAYSFPMAAITLATLLLYNKTTQPFVMYLAYVLFFVLVLIIFIITQGGRAKYVFIRG